LLRGYADDAVLHFNDGPHRWSGEHRGKAAIERFLRDFVGAGLQGEIARCGSRGRRGPSRWSPASTIARSARWRRDLRQPHRLVVRTRWGRIVEHEDFYEDTTRILTLENTLRELGIAPVEP
jgi:hypothetical protein